MEPSEHLVSLGIGNNFWFRWIGANLLGYVGGLYVNGLLARLGVPSVVLMTIIGGSWLAFGPWLVLRSYLPGLRWLSWTGATVLSQMLAFGLYYAVLYSGLVYLLRGLWPITVGITTGCCVGVCQWFVLRRHMPHAAWWIVANLVAWAAAQLVTPLVTPWSNFDSANLLAGALIGVTTGIVLVRVLPQRKPIEERTVLA